ncbi:AEC family transporter [Alkalicoccobacillus plakortidis]|uniref:AEC family transporter n=1 Tax=Alkalicoccobacillus plakortidis TaxID=444060 RepID=A0ABT0XJX2_9BACI|nr:AEC family transporter [Alkalicoccobacillus plakortidis]MCM2676203.1 AEC family transporter [Alkalicoccobacillus plakortidis]
MLELYLIFIAGFIAYRVGWLVPVSRLVLTNLLLYVTLPCLIISSLHIPFDVSLGEGIFVLILLSIYFLGSTAVIAKWTASRLNLGVQTTGVFQNLLLFGNQGFIGIAVVSQLIGTSGLFLAVVFNLVYFVLIWTYGIWVMGREISTIKLSSLWKNPGLIATAVGLCFFFMPISLPTPVFQALSDIGEMTVPLSMLVIGCFVASISLKELGQYLSSKTVWIVIFMRLLIFPVCLFLPVLLLGIPFEWLAVAVLLSATPCAPTISLFAEKYGGDTNLATVSVLITTLAASGTLPLLFWLFGWLHPLFF